MGTVWEREWFVDTNNNQALAEAIALNLTFEFDDAGLSGEFDPGDDFVLLFKQAESDSFQIVSDIFTVNGANQSVSFNLSSSLLSGVGGTGIVSIGYNLQAIPEPTSIVGWCLIGAAACCLVFYRRRKRTE
jgi:hypothetical protein